MLTFRALLGLVALACGAALYAQAPTPQPPPASGLEPEWNIAPVLREIGDHAARLLPALNKVEAKSWQEKGASETYLAQLQSSKEQAQALSDGARALARNPEKLSASLELLFRIESLETMLVSLEEGIRKYQDPRTAQMLAILDAENGTNRERLRRYVVNLAAQREQQFQVMDREAQRCRSIITTQPVTSGRKK